MTEASGETEGGQGEEPDNHSPQPQPQKQKQTQVDAVLNALKTKTHIDLSKSPAPIGDVGAAVIADALSAPSRFKIVSLEISGLLLFFFFSKTQPKGKKQKTEQGISSEGAKRIATAISTSQLSFLRSFDVSRNIIGEGARSLSTCLRFCPSLTALNLSCEFLLLHFCFQVLKF